MAEEELKPTIVPLNGKLVTSKDPMTLGIGDFQDLTNMRYKRRNPISVLGMTKYNTATVVDGTASPGTYMKTRQGFHFRKDTPTDMGHGDYTPEPEPWNPPNLDALWAYFKFDEGSGLTITDYSPLLEDGALVTTFGDPLTKFWSVDGFGYNDQTLPVTWATRTADDNRDCTYCSVVAFLKVTGSPPWTADSARGFVQLGEGGNANWVRICTFSLTTYQWLIYGGALDPSYKFGTNTPVADTWYCVFLTSNSSAVGQAVQLYVRASGGDFTLEIDSTAAYQRVGQVQTGVFAFGANNGSSTMTAGDCLYYAHATSIGCISLDDANDIYDNLKSRYDME